MEQAAEGVGRVVRGGAAGGIAAQRHRMHLSLVLPYEVDTLLLTDDGAGDLEATRVAVGIDADAVREGIFAALRSLE
jgi:hypothetical protein